MLELGIDPGYVLDVMQPYEIKSLFKKAHYRYRQSWDQTRSIVYAIAQSNSKKHLTPTSVMKFPWDDETQDDEAPRTTVADLERLKERARMMLENGMI